jgi:threonine synthase
MDPGLADEIQTISSGDAMATARRLAREEGIFAGTSTGGNVAVALRVAARLGPDRTVVTVAVDTGMKYLAPRCMSTRERRIRWRAARVADCEGSSNVHLNFSRRSG